MKPEKWLKLFIGILAGTLILLMAVVVWIDPFFHYHKPLPGFYYELSNERAQNYGIVRQFDYDALITGTSLTQNFKTSEMEEWFGCHAVKVCFSGATSKEVANLFDTALPGRRVRYVVASASDVSLTFLQDKDYLQEDFDYPWYLYNDNLPDDVSYLLNKDVYAQYVLPMIVKKLKGEAGGMTSFDDYGNWSQRKTQRGAEAMGDMSRFTNDCEQPSLTPEEAETTRANVEQNLVRIAREHPETQFYLFLPPVSVAAWAEFYDEGRALKMIEAEEAAIDLLCACENVRLYSFSTDTSLTFDLERYADTTHYGEEVNSFILRAMATDDPRYRLTKENADNYIVQMKEIYLHYDYESLADR